MELRSDDGRAAPRAGRLLVWALLLIALAVGVTAALLLGPRLTPLLDTLN